MLLTFLETKLDVEILDFMKAFISKLGNVWVRIIGYNVISDL